MTPGEDTDPTHESDGAHGAPADTDSVNWPGLPRRGSHAVGNAAGIDSAELARLPSSDQGVVVTCTDYSKEQVQVQAVDNLADFIGRSRPAWSKVRWIDVEGLTDMTVLHALAKKYDLHPLAIEDVLHVPQRPKAEDFPLTPDHQCRLFVIARMVQTIEGHCRAEQISFFLGRQTLLTFQEKPGDVWGQIRQRINTPGSRLRDNDASFLLYSLLDAIVDSCFPILEEFSDRLEDLEDEVLNRPDREIIQRIHLIKRELLLLRRAAWPMRELINTLCREPHECLSETTRTFMRDIYDHTVQIIDFIETYREFAASLTETYMSAVSNRMNEIMKVLTIMGSIFIPLTFLAGVYGMNMHIPEANYPWFYHAFWGICIVVAGTMLFWFRRRGWL